MGRANKGDPKVSLVDPSWDPDLLGQTLGNYELARVIGIRGMGTVYLGRHPVIDSRVAIKVLHARYRYDEEAGARLMSEARAVNLIGHENIVKIFDFGTTPDRRPYVVMEYLEGRSLADLMRTGAVDVHDVAPFLFEVIDALAAAHERGVVHRDLKPDNIFLAETAGRPRVKVLDFGIAKLSPSPGQGPETPCRAVLGTPQYMAPEQAAGDEIDGRADVYALGVIIYQLVTRRLPFECGSVAQTLLAQVTAAPPLPSSIDPEISPALERVILTALEKSQCARYRSMRELATALRRALRTARGPRPSLGRDRARARAGDERAKRDYIDALCAVYTGELSGAQTALGRALAIDPDDDQIRKLLTDLHRSFGD